MLTLEQLKTLAALLQPAGSEASPEVTDKADARLPSSVAKVTVTPVLLPVITARGLWLAVATTLSSVVARYAMFSEPVFDSPALFLYEYRNTNVPLPAAEGA